MRPPCHNRPPSPGGFWRRVRWDGRGRPVLRWMPWRFEDKCASWSGVGIGKETPEYPTGTPYPVAHGWDCTGCRWRPKEIT